MGLIFSRKVQKTSKHLLEDLEKQIAAKSRSKQRNQQYEKSFIGYLLLVSFVLYLVGVAVLYLYFRPSAWTEWLGYLTPLVLFPLVVYCIKKLLNMYFTNRKIKFESHLATLHEEKRRVLNEVMEKETYKTAIELLKRFDPTNPSLQATPQATPSRDHRRRPNQTPANSRGSEVRHRRQPQTPHPALMQHRVVPMATPQVANQRPVPMETPVVQPAAPTPARSESANKVAMASSSTQQFIPPGMCLGAAPGPPTPSPILPRERTGMDKMVEYLVGDGPNNRYALICQQCHSHNGMALRDEFEYTTFRCAYCYTLNPARKKKPSLLLSAAPSSAHMSSSSLATNEASSDASPLLSAPPNQQDSVANGDDDVVLVDAPSDGNHGNGDSRRSSRSKRKSRSSSQSTPEVDMPTEATPND